MLHRLTPFRIAVLLGLSLAALRLSACHTLERLDAQAVDYRLLQRGPQAGTPEVVIVAIDDASLEAIGRWPWSRALVAQLVDRLHEGGAAVIGFDIVQSEATVAPQVDGRPGRIEPVAAEDERLAQAVQASGCTVLGYFFDFSPAGGESNTIPVTDYNLVQETDGAVGRERVPLAKLARGNLPALTAAAREVGYFNFLPDADGAYRRVPLAIRYDAKMAVPLSLAMLRLYRAGQPLTISIAGFGVESVHLGHESIPVDEDGQMLINFRGPAKTFLHVPAKDVIAARVAPETFRGKLVLVGVTATALADVRVTPFDGLLPGVELHANIIDNVLRRDFIASPKWVVLVEIAVILLAVLFLGLVLHYARGVSGALAAIAMLVGYLVFSQWVFVAHGLPLSLVYPLLAIGLAYSAISVQHYVVEESEKRKIRDAFGLYLNPHLAHLVSRHPEMLALGGEKRELTVLFSDIRGFTTISEGLEPEVLVALLNEFLGKMTDVIFAHDGMLDKYIGDAIMAVWGAPVPGPDHAAQACRAALDMVHHMQALDREWKQRGLPALDIGIGLNTGVMVVGNMGSARRLSYTVIGDNVNLGSRLEGLNKLYGTHIIASEATLRAAGDVAVVRELDLVRVKGKRLPVRIFELLAPASERAHWAELVRLSATGIEAYRQRRWDDAIAAFTAVLAESPDDGPASLYLERCRAMAVEPPPPEWDGVTVMEVK